jgi:hypothetical protein
MRIKPEHPCNVVLVGRSRCGKSVVAKHLFRSWPGRKLVVDNTRDVASSLGRRGEDWTLLEDLSGGWPGDARTVVAWPDVSKPDGGLADADAAIGIAVEHGDCLVWLDEIGATLPVGKTGPSARRLLNHGRHHDVSYLACGPRPVMIDSLVLSQAMHVVMFNVPNPKDRRRLAETTGIPPAVLDEAMNRLEPFEFLWFDAGDYRLTHCPPLPLR